ncbi:MAG: hypothetical protein A3G70_07145 [Planctomycetes bacterium RIFCSPLOWO2_12_FULL_39_13]|nr:MAG: hypothetical protein A3G70_07145 [Planctomycetes bacterium RIFCSPLOWO2_12_FULL_39_13]
MSADRQGSRAGGPVCRQAGVRQPDTHSRPNVPFGTGGLAGTGTYSGRLSKALKESSVFIFSGWRTEEFPICQLEINN